MADSDNKPKRTSQGALILYHGMKLSTMLKLFSLKPTLRWSRWRQIGLMPVFGTYNSLMAGIENLLFGRKIARTEINPQPIFILGYWRSGTTLLHNLIAIDPRFAFPNLYECVFPWHFLTSESINTRFTGWMVPKSRPMDNMETNWGVPQEDEFAICTMCLVSPYTLPLRPFDLQEWTRSFRLDQLSSQDQNLWKRTVTHFMKKLSVRYDSKPLVMKSPSHTYRVKQLLELFPQAKFIYISRNPFDVFNSTLHLRTTLIGENTLGDPTHPGAENNVIDTFMEAFQAYERDRCLIPAGNLAEVKYEELVESPLREITRLYQELQLSGFEDVRPLLEEKLKDHKNYQKNRFNPDRHWRDEVYRRCREVYERFGYPAPDDSDTAAA